MSNQSSQPPTEVLRGDMGVELAIWATDAEHEGRKFMRLSGRPQKRYLDKQGQWQSTSYLSPQEWLVTAALLQEAYTRFRVQATSEFTVDSPASAEE